MKQDHTLEARVIKFLVSSNACSTGKIQNRIGFSVWVELQWSLLKSRFYCSASKKGNEN